MPTAAHALPVQIASEGIRAASMGSPLSPSGNKSLGTLPEEHPVTGFTCISDTGGAQATTFDSPSPGTSPDARAGSPPPAYESLTPGEPQTPSPARPVQTSASHTWAQNIGSGKLRMLPCSANGSRNSNTALMPLPSLVARAPGPTEASTCPDGHNGPSSSPGFAAASRRNTRRRSTGEADVQALAKLRSSMGADMLGGLSGAEHRLAHLAVCVEETLLPHQASTGGGPGGDPSSPQAPPSPSQALSPFEKMLQAQSGLASIRQRRCSSQPQQMGLMASAPRSSLHLERHGSRELADEDASGRRRASLMPSGLSKGALALPASRSAVNLPPGRSRSQLPTNSPGGASGSAHPAAARVGNFSGEAAFDQLAPGDRGSAPKGLSGRPIDFGQAAASDASKRHRRGSASAISSVDATSGAYRSLLSGLDASTWMRTSPDEHDPSSLSPSGTKVSASGAMRAEAHASPTSHLVDGRPSGGKSGGLGASQNRSNKRVGQGQLGGSRRSIGGAAEAGNGRRRSRIFDVLPDLIPLLDAEHGAAGSNAGVNTNKLLQQIRDLKQEVDERSVENASLKKRMDASDQKLRQAQREIETLKGALHERRGWFAWLGCFSAAGSRRSAVVHTESCSMSSDEEASVPMAEKA